MPARVVSRLGLAAAVLAAPIVWAAAAPASAHTPAPAPVTARAAVAAPAAVAALPSAPVVVRGSQRFSCPVGAGRTVTNSFGDARGGGRRHAGIDIMARYGTPIYAIESGTIVKAYVNRRGGLSIYLRGASGVQYFYAHQSVNLVTSGQSVRVGQAIGRVGTSGNAAATAPHLHFEKLTRGYTGAVDPFPLVRSIC